ncbi:MAG: ATP-binding protein [Limnothrix sp.]
MPSSLPDHLVIPPQVGYLLLGEQLKVLEFSEHALHFAEAPEHLAKNEPVWKSFPELVGAEELLEKIRTGHLGEYELKEVARDQLYFNLYASRIKDFLVVLFEDVTEMMQLKQSLVQRANEAELLLGALSNSKDYLDKVILSMDDALIITSELGNIKTVNQAALEMFGYGQQEFVGQSFQSFLPPEAWQSGLAPEAIAAQQSDIKNIEVDCFAKSRKPVSVEFNCSRVLTDLDQNQSFIYVGRNITERKLAERKQQKAIARERELIELKARFLSIASHEFRNPIGSILMCAEILQNPKAKLNDEEHDMYVGFIEQAGTTLKNVMEDVLVLSKADAGKIDFQPKPIDLRAFCEELIQQIHLSMDDSRICLHYRAPSDDIHLDRKLLQQILQNLLSNALKYSPDSDVVDFIAQPNPNTDGQIDFVIQDKGIGIPAEDLELIFESFHRAGNVGEIPGTGLGMTITYKSIQLHQGTIHIKSKEQQGTTVTVTLPCQAA